MKLTLLFFKTDHYNKGLVSVATGESFFKYLLTLNVSSLELGSHHDTISTSCHRTLINCPGTTQN